MAEDWLRCIEGPPGPTGGVQINVVNLSSRLMARFDEPEASGVSATDLQVNLTTDLSPFLQEILLEIFALCSSLFLNFSHVSQFFSKNFVSGIEPDLVPVQMQALRRLTQKERWKRTETRGVRPL